MGLDAGADAHVAALLELAVGGVNANLLAKLGEPAIIGAYNHPRPLKILGQGQLPSLAVYRAGDSVRRRTFGSLQERGTFIFEYVSRPVGADDLQLRRPLLRTVWKALIDVLNTTTHPDVAGGASILEVAGFTELESEVASVVYGYVDGDNLPFPFFRGTIFGWHEDPPDLSALEDLISLDMSIRLEGEGHPEGEQPILREIVQAHHDVDGSEEFDGDLVP